MGKRLIIVRIFLIIIIIYIVAHSMLTSSKTNTTETKSSKLNTTKKREHEHMLKPSDTPIAIRKENYLKGSSTSESEYMIKVDVNKTSTSFSSRDCKPVETQLSSKPLPITGLVSYPGSGNTWTRHLMEQVSGITTGSVYNCETRLKSLAHGFDCDFERHKDRVIAVKSHKRDRKSLKMFDRVILLIRNPFHAILSQFHFKMTLEHTGHAKESYFRDKAWHDHVYRSIDRWQRLNLAWLRSFSGPIYPLFYENLLSNIYMELHNIVNFLELTVTEDAIMCAIENGEGDYHRKTLKTDNGTDVFKLKELYTNDMKGRITNAIEEIKAALKKSHNIDWKYTLFLEN